MSYRNRLHFARADLVKWFCTNRDWAINNRHYWFQSRYIMFYFYVWIEKQINSFRALAWAKFIVTLGLCSKKRLNSKEVDYPLNPSKRFKRFEKASQWFQMLKKRLLTSTKPFKGSSRVPTGRTFFWKTFFLVRNLKKVS